MTATCLTATTSFLNTAWDSELLDCFPELPGDSQQVFTYVSGLSCPIEFAVKVAHSLPLSSHIPCTRERNFCLSAELLGRVFLLLCTRQSTGETRGGN